MQIKFKHLLQFGFSSFWIIKWIWAPKQLQVPDPLLIFNLQKIGVFTTDYCQCWLQIFYWNSFSTESLYLKYLNTVFKLIWFEITKFPFYFCRVSGQNLGHFGKFFEMLKILMVWENLTVFGSSARSITHGLQVTYASSQWPGWDNSQVFASSLFSTSCSTDLSVMDMLSPCSDLSYKKASVLHTPRRYPQGLTHNLLLQPSFSFFHLITTKAWKCH